jgi:hypothetical protein
VQPLKNKFHEICTEGKRLENRLIGAEHAATGSARTPSSSFRLSRYVIAKAHLSLFLFTSPFSPIWIFFFLFYF